jgi:DNA-binding transcriptional LysR family regulator
VELRHLEHFVVLAEELNFTKAAGRLSLVQSALSVSIRNLEKDLDVTLFTRTGRGVRLSREGEALLPAARRVLRDVEAARDTVAAVRNVVRGRIRIGMMQSLALINTGELFATFHREHPGVVIEPWHAPGGSAVLADRVRQGELDLAFAWQSLTSARGLRVAELAVEPFVLAMPANHRLAETAQSIEELDSEAFIDFPEGWGARTLTDQAFLRAGVQRKIVVEVADIMMGAELVRAGFGVAVMPRSQVARMQGLVSRLVSGLPQWGVSLLAPDNRPLTAAAAAFADLVCQSFDVTLRAEPATD